MTDQPTRQPQKRAAFSGKEFGQFIVDKTTAYTARQMSSVKQDIQNDLRPLYERIAALEAQTKFLVPAAMAGQLTDAHPEVVKARQATETAVADATQIKKELGLMKRQVTAKNKEIRALKDHIKKTDAMRGIASLDAVREAAKAERKAEALGGSK